MFCVKCGASIPEEEKTCPKCGASVDEMYSAEDNIDESDVAVSEKISISYKDQKEQNYDWGKTVVGKTAETSRQILRVHENAERSYHLGIISLVLLAIFGFGAIAGIFAILKAKKVFVKLPDVMVSSKTEVKFLDKAENMAKKGKLFGLISCIAGPVILALALVIILVIVL